MRIKAGLALHGYTIASWGRTKGYPRNTVWQALYYKRNGHLAQKIRRQLRPFTA